MATRNDILIQIRGDLSDLNKRLTELTGISKNAADEVEGTWDGVTGQFARLNLAIEGVQRVFRGFASVTAPILSFEQRLAEINTIARLTPEALAGVGDKLTELSRTIPQTADQLAEGLYEVLSAGITDTADALKVLEDSAKLAVGGLSNTRATVDAVTTVLNSYSLAASESGRVTDLFFAAVERGKTTVDQLAPTIGRLTPIAATLGLTLEDLFGSIATLTAGGLKTDQAITGVSSLLRSITNVSTEGQALAKSLGITWDSTTIRANGLVGTMQMLRDATGGNAEQMRMLIQDSEGYITALALTGDRMQQLERDTLAMADSTGAANKAFETMTETGQNSAILIGNAWSELIRTLDTLVLPTLLYLRENIDALKDAGKDLLIVLGLLAAGLALAFAGPLIAAGTAAVGIFASALTGASGAIGLLVSWLTAAAGSIGAVKAVMGLFADDTKKAKDEVAGLNTVLQLPPEKAVSTYKRIAGSTFSMVDGFNKAATAAKTTTAAVVEEGEKQVRALDTLNKRIIDRTRDLYSTLQKAREDHDLLMGRLELERRRESDDLDERLARESLDRAQGEQNARLDLFRQAAAAVSAISAGIGESIVGAFQGNTESIRNGLKQVLLSVLDFIREMMIAAKLATVAKATLTGNPLTAFLTAAKIIGPLEVLFATLRAGITAFAEGSGPITKPTLALIGENVRRSGAELVVPEKRFIDWAREAMPKMASAGTGMSEKLLQGIDARLGAVEAAILGQPRSIGRETARAMGSLARGAL